MLHSYSISSFKQLKNFELTNLSRVNIFLGESSVGKTSAMQSLMFYFSMDNKKRFIDEFFHGHADYLFPYKKPIDITLTASFSNSIQETKHFPFLSKNFSFQNKYSNLISLPFSIYESNTILSEKEIVNAFLEIEKKGKKDELIVVLRSIENELVNLYVKENTLYMKTKYQTTPFDYSGTGMKRLFTIYHLLISQKNSPFFLDLVEKGFHPLYLRWLAVFFYIFSVKYNRQLFLSSYSFDLVSSFLRSNMNEEDLTVIYMEKDKYTIYKGKESEHIPYPYRTFY